MKRKILLSILGLFFVFVFVGNVWAGEADSENSSRCGSGPGHANPADLYCLELGYQLEAVEGGDGGQHSICVFHDGSTCDAWRFFEGKCGERHSYCAKIGCRQITKTDGKNPFSPHYAVCVYGGVEVGAVTELMGLSERYERSIHSEEKPPALKQSPPPKESFLAPAALPTSFDWRNYNGQNWMTSVKNQSACGSCWAFSAVGTVEPVYNIDTDFPDLDLNLSEEFLNSDCPSPNPGSCCGGGHTSALNIIRDDGIPDEDCMPYDVGYYNTGHCSCYPNPPCNPLCSGLPASCSHLNCSDACADMASRLVIIDSYTYVPDTPSHDKIKQKLVDEGPLAVCLAMSGTYDAQNVYRCTTCWDRNQNGTCETVGVCGAAGVCTSGIVGQDCTDDAHCDEDKNDDGVCDQADCGTNHCVVLVGYDDARGYWIVKNSWGDNFGPLNDGYWNVGYGECHIEDYVYYVDTADINFPPIANANGPYSAECQGATTDVPLDGSGSDDPNEGDILTFSWTTNCPGGSFDDDTSETPVLTVDTSPGCSVACSVTLTVTDDAGNEDTDTASVTISDTVPPEISCPSDITIECDESTDSSNTGNAIATDVCDPSPVITYSDVETPGACAAEKTITRTWEATDECENTSTCDQIITVVDTTPPVIACNAPATITPPDAPISFTATAVDNCDPAPSVSITAYGCRSFTKKGKEIDKTESCIVDVDGDTIMILDSGGVGTQITWTVRAVDECENASEVNCMVDVVKKGKP